MFGGENLPGAGGSDRLADLTLDAIDYDWIAK